MDEEFAAYTLINLSMAWHGIRGRAEKTLNETAKETKEEEEKVYRMVLYEIV